MKTIYKNTKLMALLLGTGLALASCGMSQTAEGASEDNIVIGNPTNNRTSSDMNISPANINTSDPAIKMQDTLTTPKAPSEP